MIQFNLLPDVKLDFIRARRTKRLVTLLAAGVTLVSMIIFVGLFMIVNVFQKDHLQNVDNDIATTVKQLEQIPDLDKVLTIQNQLSVLTSLHEQKPTTSRLHDYLIQLTPQRASIAETKVDIAEGTIEITGTADAVDVVNKFADTLKFTNYKDGESDKKAFSEVTLANFAFSKEENVLKVSYSISAKFDPAIFDTTKQVSLNVPNIISTRSVTEKPTDLFKALPKEESEN